MLNEQVPFSELKYQPLPETSDEWVFIRAVHGGVYVWKRCDAYDRHECAFTAQRKASAGRQKTEEWGLGWGWVGSELLAGLAAAATAAALLKWMGALRPESIPSSHICTIHKYGPARAVRSWWGVHKALKRKKKVNMMKKMRITNTKYECIGRAEA